MGAQKELAPAGTLLRRFVVGAFWSVAGAIFVVLVGSAWVLIPKPGALGLAATYGFVYACTSLFFSLSSAKLVD